MSESTLFTTTPSERKGDVYSTKFKFELDDNLSFSSICWDLGDGNVHYDRTSLEHIYNYPGLYTVSLSAWTKSGFLYTDATQLDVDFAYRDSVSFSSVPASDGMSGMRSSDPFVVSVVSSKIDTPIKLVLQALNTESIPEYTVRDKKWYSIIPKWKFIDAETNQLLKNNEILLKTEPIYKNSNVVAVSGKASFYFVDDLPTTNRSCPLLITATLSALHFVYPLESLTYPYYSYSNSDVTRAAISWQIQTTYPTQLKLTENFVNEIYPIKWSNTPIPVLITCEFLPQNSNIFATVASLSQIDVLSYPQTNAIGKQAPVRLRLVDESDNPIPEHLYAIEHNGQTYPPSSAPLFFQKTDESGGLSSGYIFTTVIPLTSFSFKTKIEADSTIFIQLTSSSGGTGFSFPFPSGLPIHGEAYVSHPLKANINKIRSATFSKNSCNSTLRFDELNLLDTSSASIILSEIQKKFDLSRYSLSGTSAIYGMAFHPLKNILYAVDADLDMLFTFDQQGTITNAIHLSSYTDNTYNVPSYVSLDGGNNIYISLYGNQSVLKLNESFTLLFSSLPTSFSPLTAEAFGSPFVAPPVVEVDSQDNFWTCYCHPLSSKLIKFNGTDGTQMFEASALSLSANPISLAIDIFDNVWVACYESNQVQCYSGVNGSLLHDLNFFIHPSYVAIDRNNNVWALHGYDKCSVYNQFTGSLSSWSVGTPLGELTDVSNVYSSSDINNATNANPLWGGLSIDVYDRVWSIDTANNKIYAFDAADPSNSWVVTDIVPSSNTNPVVVGGSTRITLAPGTNIQSAQAAGDWTGNRWYQLHSSTVSYYPVTGESAFFQVYDINDSFQIAKVNEEFDTAQYFKDLALPEILKNNSALFDNFFAAVAGDGNPTKESIGRVVYERIANFIQTHGDFETSEIKQLMSFAEQIGVKSEKFGNFFPAEIERLLNLFSVNKHFLRGRKKYNTSIADTIGDRLTETSLVTANRLIYLQDKRQSTYNLVFVNALSSSNIYPLSSIEIEGIRKPLLQNYYVYTYNESEDGYQNNIINWDSSYTTLNYNLSTNEEWYGDDGLVDVMFNNLLTKRLFHSE